MVSDLTNINKVPQNFSEIMNDTKEIGFTLYSDHTIGLLLRSLVSAKSKVKVLELGTGTGLASSWIIEGLDENSNFHTVENDLKLLSIFKKYYGEDQRIKVFEMDGEKFLKEEAEAGYDIIFADTWQGKYNLLNETLELLSPRGIYIIDDMIMQPEWPEDHIIKVKRLIRELNNRSDLLVSSLDISTVIIIATKVG